MNENIAKIEDAALRDGLTRFRRRPPFSEDELREVSSLHAGFGARSLADLVYVPNLSRLYLNWSCIDDYSGVTAIGRTLEWLEINCSTVTNLEFLRECPNLRVLELRFNHIEDISPLLEHENLENLSIDIRGNPLTTQSFYDILPALVERAGRFRSIDEECWKLQRRMWEAGHRASYGSMRGHEMVVQSLACRLGEKVRFEIRPSDLERELSAKCADVEVIARKYWTPPYSRESCTDRGDADQAREWIAQTDVTLALAESLRRLVDRVDNGMRFAREQPRICDAVERAMYGWAPLPEPAGGRPGLPDWLRQWRKALAYVEKDGKEVALRFRDDGTVARGLRGQPVVFRPMGVTGVDARRALIDRFRAFPVAWLGPSAQSALVLRLDSPDVHDLYLVDSAHIFEWSFDPWQTRAFEGPQALVDALDGPADDVHDRLAELGAQPPSIEAPKWTTFDMSAEQAREHLTQVELDDELGAALIRLVDGFEGLSFHRENERGLQYYEVLNQEQFPEWYRRWRTALAHPLAAEETAAQTRLKLSFRPGSFEDRQGYSDKEWALSPPGVHLGHLRYRLIDRYGALPIGHETHDVLAIRLDGSDQRIYTFDPTLYGADEDFDPFESPVFEGPAVLVDAIASVGTSKGWVERANSPNMRP